jgi:hypothetical protein
MADDRAVVASAAFLGWLEESRTPMHVCKLFRTDVEESQVDSISSSVGSTTFGFGHAVGLAARVVARLIASVAECSRLLS